MIAYTVSCTFDDPLVAREWLDWLRDEHLAEVGKAGALDAEVLQLDAAPGAPVRCEVRYHFSSRESFAAYERDHAPALRAKGLARFPPERGLRYERSVGPVLVRVGTSSRE